MNEEVIIDKELEATEESADSEIKTETEDVSEELEGSLVEDQSEEVCEEVENTDNSDVLREKIKQLREHLDRIEREHKRMFSEIGEFSEVFPNVSLEVVPSEVWSSVKSGVPLAAAYALYEKKSRAQLELADMVNQKNAERSSGALKGESDDQFYSPSEVRKMSPREVRAKYNLIIESMKKWN